MSETSRLKRTNYQKLPTIDRSSVDDFILPIQQPETNNKRWRLKWILIATTIVLITCLISWWLHSKYQGNPSWVGCGESPETARENGCIYEPMQRSWIPKACYFAEPGDEYHPFEDRPWFYDANLTQPLDQKGLDKMRNGDDLTAYSPSFFHHDHCLYVWRKLALAVERRLPLIDSKVGNKEHARHCAHIIAMDLHKVSIHEYEKPGVVHVSTSPIMFQTCVELAWR